MSINVAELANGGSRWDGTIESGDAIGSVADAVASGSASQITRLNRGLDRMRMERDVLEKAIGIFAEVPR